MLFRSNHAATLILPTPRSMHKIVRTLTVHTDTCAFGCIIKTHHIQTMKNKIVLVTLIAALSGAGDVFSAEPPNFKSADKNNDGKLSPGEFAAADAGRKGDENTKQMFEKIDTDHDGFVSMTEFAPYRVRRGDTTKKPEKKKKTK